MRNFMKKSVLLGLFLVLCLSVFAQERNGTVSGDYVIYKDNSFISDTWVGFLYYNANTYGAVLYTPSDKRRVGILFSVKEKNGKLITTGQNIISDVDPSNKQDVEAINYLMQLLPDMYAWSTDPQKFVHTNYVIKKHKRQFDKIAYFNGKINVGYLSYLPLFYIDNIFGADGRSFLELERIGRIAPNGDPVFFNFLIPFPKNEKSKLKLNKKATKQVVNINSLKLNLTEQWKPLSDNYFMLDNSAILMVTNLPKAEKTDFKDDVIASLVKRLCLSDKNRTVMMNKMELEGNTDKFILKNQIYDKKTQKVKIDIKTLIKNSDDSYTMISLTVNKSDYDNNKSYFNNLY